MAETDFLKLYSEVNKNALKSLIKNRNFMTDLVLVGLTGTNLVLNESAFLRLINSFILSSNIVLLKKFWEQEKSNERHKIYEELEKTETYKECKKEYEQFIAQTATLVKSSGLKKPKEITLYIYALIRLGYLSNGSEHKYKNYQFDKNILLDLLGTRVLSGTSVCRHTTYFMNDVLKEIGLTSAAIATRTESEAKKILSRRKLETDHAINGVEEYGKIFMFDTTTGCFVSKTTNEQFINLPNIYEPVVENIPAYYMVNTKFNEFNDINKAQATRLMQLDDSITSLEESNELFDKIKRTLEKNLMINESFHQITTPQRQRIVTLSKTLMPYGDKPITEWKVK